MTEYIINTLVFLFYILFILISFFRSFFLSFSPLPPFFSFNMCLCYIPTYHLWLRLYLQLSLVKWQQQILHLFFDLKWGQESLGRCLHSEILPLRCPWAVLFLVVCHPVRISRNMNLGILLAPNIQFSIMIL